MTTPPSARDEFNICVRYKQALTLALQHTIYFTVSPRLMMLTVMRAVCQRFDILSSENYMFYYQNAAVSPLVSIGELGLEQGSVIIHLPFSNFFKGEMHFNLVSAVLAKNRFVVNADLGLYDDHRMDAAIARIVAPDKIGRIVEDGLLPFETYRMIKGRWILFFNHVLFSLKPSGNKGGGPIRCGGGLPLRQLGEKTNGEEVGVRREYGLRYFFCILDDVDD
jgi:hypothetical protein